MASDPWSFLTEPEADRLRSSASRTPDEVSEFLNALPTSRPAATLPASTPRPQPSPAPTTATTAKVARRVPSAFAWIPRRLASIRGNPEDSFEEPWFSRRSVMGYAASTGFHLIILLFLLLAVVLGTRPEAPLRIETSLGTPFGVEEGLDAVGGFEDDLLDDVAKPTELSPASLLEAPEPEMKIDSSAILSAATREGGSTSGVGGGAEFGVAKFGNGLVESIRGVQVKVGDPQFTLIWDTPADIDLHVLEPGGSHIFWEERNGEKGGELDVDDVDGLGPENIYWVVGRNEDGTVLKGRGPTGRYQWYVEYYGGYGGRATPTRWKVRVKHGKEVEIVEGVLRRVGEKSRTFVFDMGGPDSDASAPQIALPSVGVDARGSMRPK